MSGKKAKHDNHNDPSGRVLFRTWLYSGSKEGRDYRYDELGDGVIQAKETRRYAPIPVTLAEIQQEALKRQESYQSALSKLTDLERAVLHHQGKLQVWQEVRLTIAAGDLVEYQRNGYTLDPGSAREVERPGMASLSCVDVVGKERMQIEPLDYDEIASLLGVSVFQVHRAVKSANKKLRGRNG